MAPAKTVRVRVVRGFVGYAPEGEEKPTHLPGAVIDLEENYARVELVRNRVVEVDSETPLADGVQSET